MTASASAQRGDASSSAGESLAQRLKAPMFAAGGAAAVSAALLLRDPHARGSWGVCPFLALTGMPCPACGGLRATNDLLRGDVAAALSSNAYTVGTIALFAGLWLVWTVRQVRGATTPWQPLAGRLPTIWLIGLVVFGVARFFPGLSALQP